MVGFFGALPSGLKDVYKLVVESLRSVQFGLVDNPDTVQHFARFEDRVVIFRPNFLRSPHEEQQMVHSVVPSYAINDLLLRCTSVPVRSPT